MTLPSVGRSSVTCLRVQRFLVPAWWWVLGSGPARWLVLGSGTPWSLLGDPLQGLALPVTGSEVWSSLVVRPRVPTSLGPTERWRGSAAREDEGCRGTGRGSEPPGPGDRPRPRPEERAPRTRTRGGRTH